MGKRSKNTSVFCGWGEWYWTVTCFFPRTQFIVSGGKSQLFFSGCKRKQGHTTCYSSSPTILIPLFWVGWKHLKHTTQIRTQLLGWYWRLSKTFLIHFSVCKPQEAPTLHCFFPTCLVRSSSFLPSFLFPSLAAITPVVLLHCERRTP